MTTKHTTSHEREKSLNHSESSVAIGVCQVVLRKRKLVRLGNLSEDQTANDDKEAVKGPYLVPRIGRKSASWMTSTEQ